MKENFCIGESPKIDYVALGPINETAPLIGDKQNQTATGSHYNKNSLQSNARSSSGYDAYTPTCLESCCFCVYKRYELNQGQVYVLNEARDECSILFNKEDEAHRFYVIKLWEKVFPGQELDPVTLKSDQWKTIGFQNVDPSTDFRGGGLMAARNLLYFTQNYSDVRKTTRQAFATSGVSILPNLIPRNLRGSEKILMDIYSPLLALI
mmetsp:Transcript_45421/g.52262  ORF Transcript_45421/g.52262 Transcript_45421/m.52262 type:complete len:208 (+) Transcript_45421:224-847(+)